MGRTSGTYARGDGRLERAGRPTPLVDEQRPANPAREANGAPGVRVVRTALGDDGTAVPLVGATTGERLQIKMNDKDQWTTTTTSTGKLQKKRAPKTRGVLVGGWTLVVYKFSYSYPKIRDRPDPLLQ